MAAKLEKTRTPGVYRRGGRYAVIFRDGSGQQRQLSARTLDEARKLKAARTADVARGEFAPSSRMTLHDYSRAWIERYQGTGRRGFREETRAEYTALLEKYALSYFPARILLTELDPRRIADFIGWLVKQPTGRVRCDGCAHVFPASKAKCPRCAYAAMTACTLSDKSVRNALGPLTACLATARREGLIRHNPASEAALPHRARVAEDEDRPRPFPRVTSDDGETVETMELVVALVHPRHRLMFDLLAATGMRRSELLALEGRHLVLDGATPHVKVRQRVRRRRGEGLVIGPLKSRHSRRDLPISLTLADRLRALRTLPNELVFRSATGTMLDPDNIADRVLAPACAEAGVEWAGFHTFRHTVASRLFAAGRNVVQVQRWLGHHSPSFTLETYVHLLDEQLPSPVEPLVPSPTVPEAAPGLPVETSPAAVPA